MNPASDDIKDILEAGGIGLTLGNNLFVGKEPDSPNVCVTIFDTPGRAPQLTYKQGEDFYFPSVQVRVRDINYLEGWDMINNIKGILHATSQETWNGTLYSLIRCTIEPSLLDWDENDRCRFVSTFDIQRR